MSDRRQQKYQEVTKIRRDMRTKRFVPDYKNKPPLADAIATVRVVVAS